MNFNSKDKRAFIEMSMTTIVTIVLVVVTLVLALVLIKTIFTSSTNAVSQVNDAIQNQINQLFSSGNSNLVIYPADQSITLKRGGSTPMGFAFAVKNPNNKVTTFFYNVTETGMHNCGSLTSDDANGYLIAGQGSFTAGPGAQSDTQLFKFDIPQGAPACTITYELVVTDGAQFSTSQNLFVTLQ